ncbi:hypothetical protein BC629DRAFT_1080274 [Irpex lacteus]|nr:hypothetical protein BC629DRAFT_1080274 [Irpex lacteus]
MQHECRSAGSEHPRSGESALLGSEPASIYIDSSLESRSRHNASQCILKLPPELLCLVIKHLRIIYPPIGMFDTYRDDLSIAESSQSDSLGSGELWSDIRCEARCTRWLSEWLRRSDSTPLALTLLPWRMGTGEDQKINTLFVEAPHHLTRLRSIEIELMPSPVRGSLRTLLTGLAPQLEAINIDAHTPTLLFLPTPWFTSATAPRLYRLVVSGLCFPWTTAHLPHLTHLHISYPFSRDSAMRIEAAWPNPATGDADIPRDMTHPSMDHVWGCLHRFPLLQTLRLYNALPSCSDIEAMLWPGRAGKISMPSLREIRIEDHCHRCAVFLAALDTPQLESLDVELSSGTRSSDGETDSATMKSYRWMVEFFASYAQHSDQHSILGLDIEVNMYNWSLKAYLDSNIQDTHTDESAYTSRPLFSFAVSRLGGDMIESVQREHLADLKTLIGALPLDNVETLLSSSDIDHAIIAGIEVISTDLWRHIYKCCSTAKVLHVVHTAIIHCVPLLAAGNSNTNLPHSLRIDDEQIPMLQALTHLSLKFEKMWARRGEYVADSLVLWAQLDPATTLVELTQQYVQVIRDCLASRSGHTTSLKYLELDVCATDDGDADLRTYELPLHEVAAEVEVILSKGTGSRRSDDSDDSDSDELESSSDASNLLRSPALIWPNRYVCH